MSDSKLNDIRNLDGFTMKCTSGNYARFKYTGVGSIAIYYLSPASSEDMKESSDFFAAYVKAIGITENRSVLVKEIILKPPVN